MALAPEDIEFIKAHLTEWLEEASPRLQFERELHERVIRVEEALAHQRELMQQGFAALDKRLEALREEMNQRFEQVDKRFEQMDRRFEALTRRIDRFMIWSFGLTLTAAGLIVAVVRLWP